MKKRVWIAVFNILLVLCLFVVGSYAAYTSRSYVKGVATTLKQVLGLSSDFLVVVSQASTEDKYAVRKILLEEKSTEDDTPYVISFYIQNSSDGSVSEKSMRYTFNISGLSPNAVIERDGIDITEKASGTGSISPLMSAYTKMTHFYKIIIPKDEIKSINEIVVKAVPDSDSDSSGNMIAAKIQPSVAGKVAGFSYRSVFIDETAVNIPAYFAAFNYEVSIINATEPHCMRLTWDNRYVEIDPLFLSKINQSPVDGDDKIKYVEFYMDAVNNNYLIHFYRMDGQNTTSEWQNSWNNLKDIITFVEVTQNN